MKRRIFLLGTLGLGAAAVGGAFATRPKAQGRPHDAYFKALGEELSKNGPMRPSLVVDLDRLDHNIGVVMASVRAPKHLRIVEKSLPSPKLIDYIARKAGTQRLMSFHQPFLNADAVTWPASDILLGKPLPVRSAELFYGQHKGEFDPARQLQWLIDTPARLQQYLELAKGLGTRMRINVEIDVGLHRGGVADNQALGAILGLIAKHPEQLEFAGFMGYDPHVVKVPEALGSRDELFKKSMAAYQGFVDFTRKQHAKLWRGDLTLNAAGSPTYRLHEAEKLSNDISVGTGLLKPTHFDVPTLSHHVPAVYIATPVLKATGAVNIPGLDDKSRLLSWWDANQQATFFIYGGNWMADFVSPPGLRGNTLYGHSSNQEIANGSTSVGLKVDDQVFLRPWQTEAVLLQFGDLIAVRGGEIIEYWPVLG